MVEDAVLFGITRGELLLVAFIFGLIYLANVLPKLAARLERRSRDGSE